MSRGVTPQGLAMASATDTGQRRDVNQDAVAHFRDPAGRFAALIVCDGLGGLAAGDVASTATVQGILHALADCPGDPRDCLADGLVAANSAILEASRSRGRMGTTVVAVLFTSEGFEVFHVGDSRAYLLRDGSLEPLTTDHSWVMEQVAAGRMTEEEAARDGRRNVITRAVGTDAMVSVDRRGPEPLHPGDVVIASTDGLHGVVPPDEIERLAAHPDPAVAASALIRRANELGGPDNIGVALARAGHLS